MTHPNGTTNQWGKGKCVALTAGLCALFLLPLLISKPLLGLCALGLATCVYLGLLKIFGDGFVIEGAILVVIMAILLTLLLPALMKARARAIEHPLSSDQHAPVEPGSLPAMPGR